MQASPGSAGSHALADLPAAAAHGVLSSLGDGSPPRTGRVVSACHFPGLVETSNSTHLEKMLKELFKSHWPVFYFQILMFSDFFFFFPTKFPAFSGNISKWGRSQSRCRPPQGVGPAVSFLSCLVWGHNTSGLAWYFLFQKVSLLSLMLLKCIRPLETFLPLSLTMQRSWYLH